MATQTKEEYFTYEVEFIKEKIVEGIVIYKYDSDGLHSVFFIPLDMEEVHSWILEHGEEGCDYTYEETYDDVELSLFPFINKEELANNLYLFALTNQERWVQGS